MNQVQKAHPMPDKIEDMPHAPLVQHLIELRHRLMVAFGFLTLVTCVSYIYAQDVYGVLIEPLARAMEGNGTQRLIYTGLSEAFFTYLRVAFFAGLFISFPVILMQIWMFVAPGLYAREKPVFLTFMVVTPLLFYLGGACVYFIVLPIAWSFFLSFQSTGAETILPIELEARVSEYLDLTMTLMIAFGAAFELPVVLMLLARAGIVNADMLARRRKYAIVAAFIIAAPLTPPDIISQTALAVPLILLYEISILLIRWMGRRDA